MADGDKIRVIIVDDTAETRDNLEKILYFEKDIPVVGKAATGRAASAQARQHLHNISQMAINMHHMDGSTASEQIIATVPDAQVIIMRLQGDSDYPRRATTAGAHEFRPKPISGDGLVNRIRHVHKL